MLQRLRQGLGGVGSNPTNASQACYSNEKPILRSRYCFEPPDFRRCGPISMGIRHMAGAGSFGLRITSSRASARCRAALGPARLAAECPYMAVCVEQLRACHLWREGVWPRWPMTHRRARAASYSALSSSVGGRWGKTRSRWHTFSPEAEPCEGNVSATHRHDVLLWTDLGCFCGVCSGCCQKEVE